MRPRIAPGAATGWSGACQATSRATGTPERAAELGGDERGRDCVEVEGDALPTTESVEVGKGAPGVESLAALLHQHAQAPFSEGGVERRQVKHSRW